MELVTNGELPNKPSIAAALESLKPGLELLREDLDRKSNDIKAVEETLRSSGLPYEVFHFRKRYTFRDMWSEYGQVTEGYFLAWMKDEHGKFRLHDVRARFAAGDEEKLNPWYDVTEFISITHKRPAIEAKADDRIMVWYDLPAFLKDVQEHIQCKVAEMSL